MVGSLIKERAASVRNWIGTVAGALGSQIGAGLDIRCNLECVVGSGFSKTGKFIKDYNC